MSVRVTKGTLKASESRESEYGEGIEEPRPRNIPVNTSPTDGFSLEVDAKAKSQHSTLKAAMNAGAELKRKFPMIQVTIYDATAKTRSVVEAAK